MKAIWKGILLICLFVVVLKTVTAQTPTFDANKGFLWLVNHCPKGNCENDMVSTAFYTLALKNSGALAYADQGLEYIKSREDHSEHCWPSGGCKVKDTAFALWVLNEYGQDTEGAETYLRNAVSAAPELRDHWYLEVVTSNSGLCKISYDKAGESIQKDVRVEEGKFLDCSSPDAKTFFDLNACLEPGLLTNNPSIELDVNCNELGPSTILSVIFTKDSVYHIIKKTESSRELFTIENGCFGSTKKSSCSLDTTLFSNWILNAAGSDISVRLYAQNAYDQFSVVNAAFLYLSSVVEIRDQYLNDLVALQRNDGSFNKQVYETALAALALKESGKAESLNNALEWLKEKQDDEGSWENNEFKTALVLYAAFSGAAISLPPAGGGGFVDEPIFECGDGFCDQEFEDANNCPDDCTSEAPPTCEVNGICETFFEDSLSCPQDCSCGDGVCDRAESEFSCPGDCGGTLSAPVCGNGLIEGSEQCDMDTLTGLGSDAACPGLCQPDCTCEEESGFPWWISIILALIAVSAILFFIKFKHPKPKNSQKSDTFKPWGSAEQQLPKQAPSWNIPVKQTKSKIDEELDKSIDEAKKLLKKF